MLFCCEDKCWKLQQQRVTAFMAEQKAAIQSAV